MPNAECTTEVDTLKEVYGEIDVATGTSGRQLIRIRKAALPRGCTPSHTAVLLLLQSGRPQVYVQLGIKLPNGRTPRSTSLVTVEGESWMQFSYTFPWDETRNTLLQFVEANLRRFGMSE